MKTKMLLILIVLIALGVGGVFVYKNIFAPEEEGAQPIPESALKSKFGYTTSDYDLEKNRNIWNPVGAMFERDSCAGFANWQQIEPERGQYSWEKIDEYVRGAQERNIQILFTVWHFTDWDQETCNMHLKWQPTGLGKDPRDDLSLAHRKGKPCDMEAYKEFLRRLVERYDGDGLADMPGLRYSVKYWEIGNEPDADGSFWGSDKDYFEILKASYITIKDTDPNAKVLIAAFVSLSAHVLGAKIPEWAHPDFNPVELFELGASRYFDIMNVHSFCESKEVRDFLKIYGAGDKPIWVTEPGGIQEYLEKAIGKHVEKAEEGDIVLTEDENIALVTLFKEAFEKEFQYGVERIFLGGPESIDQALHEAVLSIEKSEERI